MKHGMSREIISPMQRACYNLGKVNRPTMFFYLAVATETKSGANFFA